MAVDWLRSCYQSEWALWRDNPALMIRGRYYFSPPGTPFYAGQTLLGSRAWDDNYTAGYGDDPPGLAPILGESRTASHRWDSGAPPTAVPQAVPLGSLDCIASGDTTAESVPPADQIEGFPAGCFAAPDPNPDYIFGFSIWSCPTQGFWATVISWLYAAQADQIEGACSERFRGSATTVFAAGALYPPFAIIVHPDYACIAAAGTETLAQGLIQALQLIAGPQDFGAFSTASVWYGFASYLLAKLAALGVTDGRPLLLTGHSYGGAAAIVGAARALLGQPGRAVKWLTFGTPKPGDVRLWKQLQAAEDGLALVNDGDLVAALPPSLRLLAALTTLLPGGPYTAWLSWVYPPETARMVGAKLIKNDYQEPDSAFLAAYLAATIATGTLGDVPEHAISAYLATIKLRCKVAIPVAALIGEVVGMGVLPGYACPFYEFSAVPPGVVMLRIYGTTGELTPLEGRTCYLTNTVPCIWQGEMSNLYDQTVSFLLVCGAMFWGLLVSYEGGQEEPTVPVTDFPLLYSNIGVGFELTGTMNVELTAAVPCPPEPPMTPGMILPYAGTTVPAGFLPCDGSAVSRAAYPNLFGAIGTTWGAGDGSTTFNVPDLRGRSPVGTSPGGLGTDRPSARALAATGGEETHQLITTELSGHTHALTDPSHVHSSGLDILFLNDANNGIAYDPLGGLASAGTYNTAASPTGITIGTSGGDTPHNNMQPFGVCSWVISY